MGSWTALTRTHEQRVDPDCRRSAPVTPCRGSITDKTAFRFGNEVRVWQQQSALDAEYHGVGLRGVRTVSQLGEGLRREEIKNGVTRGTE